ncbi:O-fucosyltransferase 13-like [Dendrobium catenatum]|uniref:O-fucosyltransferase 13-like n=1 Tax=Dendrobium catenatum TaxID=906689 RepID=UPI0009F3496A|nr:O-fucosyltransferase 13-like [Dendrobium catenatum]
MASNSWHHHIRPLSGTLLLAFPLLLIALFFAARSSPFSTLSLSRNPSSLPASRRGSVIWSANRLFEWRPCGWWTDKAITALPARSNGYVRIDCYGGLNQMRRDLCDGVGIARLLNATLVLPKFEVAAYWNESSGFEDIFDVDYFIQQTKGFVEVVKELPNDLASKEPFKVDCSKRKGNFDYVEAVLPTLKKHHYISITPAMSQRRDRYLFFLLKMYTKHPF